jgi:hypothetical protein
VRQRPPRALYNAHDAVELALLDAVLKAAGARRGRGAWERLRVEIGRPDGSEPLWAVIDLGLHEHGTAKAAAEVVDLTVTAAGPFRVLALHEIAAKAIAAYRATVERKPVPTPAGGKAGHAAPVELRRGGLRHD